MIDFKEIADADNWELFARDFFAAMGFVIEQDPSRGPDGGKDLIISEQLSGHLHTRKFTWLVSCKHNALSKKAVGLEDESNILERLAQHKCDGFMGFYSTLASTALSTRLTELKQQGKIQDFCIFDHQKISGFFYEIGHSKLANRYFPAAYARLRPLQQFTKEHVELNCAICGIDWIKQIMIKPQMGIIVQAEKDGPDGISVFEDVFVACKGDCDRQLKDRLRKAGFDDRWEDIEDLCNPLFFLKNILTYTNILHSGKYKYSEKAHQRIKEVYIAIAQRVLREVTAEDKERFAQLSAMEGL